MASENSTSAHMLEARLVVSSADAELAADRLRVAGARAIEERDRADRRTEFRTFLGDDEATARSAVGALPEGWELSFVLVDTTPADTWREFAQPIDIADRLRLTPAWIAPDAASPRACSDDRLEIRVDPGAAFGLGDHPTTRLSAELLDALALRGARVLDVGCGTGVLSVIAARRHAACVVAIDIAEAACDATRRNAALNNAQIEVSSTPLSQVKSTFDVVVANILAPVLVALAPDLVRVTAPSGRLIVSGVLVGQHQHVLAALAPMTVARSIDRDGWAAIELHAPRVS